MPSVVKIAAYAAIIGTIAGIIFGIIYLVVRPVEKDSWVVNFREKLDCAEEKLDRFQATVNEMENRGENVIGLKENLHQAIALHDNAVMAWIEDNRVEAETLLEEVYTILRVSILIDVLEPTIEIISPESGTATDAATIVLEAKVTDDKSPHDELDVTVATAGALPQRVWLDAEGYFSIGVPLIEGTNLISIVAVDRANNSGIATVEVTRTVTPWATYGFIILIVALTLAAIAIFRKRV